MSAFFISLLTLVLILISAFVVLLVLMQRTSQSGGMGAALGGGAAESAFGSDTTNVLTKATIYGIVAFFVVSLGLYLVYQSSAAERNLTLNPKELISAENSDFEGESSVSESILDPIASDPVTKITEEAMIKTETVSKAGAEEIKLPTADAGTANEDSAVAK